jgi:hypothetical protein
LYTYEGSDQCIYKGQYDRINYFLLTKRQAIYVRRLSGP